MKGRIYPMKLNPYYVSGFKGFKEILKLRSKMRQYGKKHRVETARVRENRSPGGVGR